jgi:predicted nucleotidyltransferase
VDSETVAGLLKSLKERLQSLLKDNLVRVILFGSRARGEAADDSDIDMAVVVREASRGVRESILHEVAELEFEHCQAISLLIFSDAEVTRVSFGFYFHTRVWAHFLQADEVP